MEFLRFSLPIPPEFRYAAQLRLVFFGREEGPSDNPKNDRAVTRARFCAREQDAVRTARLPARRAVGVELALVRAARARIAGTSQHMCDHSHWVPCTPDPPISIDMDVRFRAD
jgi:hypothetical protein